MTFPSATGINWSDLDVMSDSGINWARFEMFSVMRGLIGAILIF